MNSPRSSPDRFALFAQRYCGLTLEPFQRLIVAEAFSDRRELLVLLPRGNGKTTLFAALALWELLSTPEPAVYCAAASREQARLLFETARKMVQAHPDLDRRITSRHAELRANGGILRVLASDAPKVHGLTPTMALVDELHAHRDAELYLALRTAMLKRPGARMVTISTAGYDPESPLGRLRARALAALDIRHDGPLTTAYGPSLAMLEWSVGDDWAGDDLEPVKDANPASWITLEGLAEQRDAVQDSAFRRYHANQWTVGEHHWLPPGAWARCAATYDIEPGERVWVGVDVGGERSASAVVWCTEDLRVGCAVFHGDDAVLAVAEHVRQLAGDYSIAEVAYDPWRFQQAALELSERGVVAVEFPQSNARMGPASERLHAAIVEGRLKHPDDPTLNAHVRNAIAKDTPRGWRIDKLKSRDNIDGTVALAMAVERAEQRTTPVQVLGWL